MEANLKLNAFEYTLEKLGEWYMEVNSTTTFPSFSKLKAFKLLFFVSSAEAHGGSLGLLETFDNHHALPYGPVESDIYDGLQNMTNFYLKGYDILPKIDRDNYDSVALDVKTKIDEAITTLKKKNTQLITLNPFDLVDISHKWYSWQFTFDLAQKLNQRSKKISNELIARDLKIYSL
jgi:uncharacterized phage-associated protein